MNPDDGRLTRLLSIVCPSCKECSSGFLLAFGQRKEAKAFTLHLIFLSPIVMDELDRAIRELRVAQSYTPSEEDLQNLEYLESLGA